SPNQMWWRTTRAVRGKTLGSWGSRVVGKSVYTEHEVSGRRLNAKNRPEGRRCNTEGRPEGRPRALLSPQHVELRRFELLTSSMRTKRATNCAIAPAPRLGQVQD